MKPLRIAISGAHGTGKTTLIAAFAHRLADDRVVVVDEAARALVKRIGQRNYYLKNFTLEKQLTSCLYQLMREQEFIDARAKGADYMIFDRTLMDAWAYMTVLFPDYAKSAVGRQLSQLVAARCKRAFDKHFITDVEFPLAVGDDRNASAGFRHTVHKRLLKLFETAEIEFSLLRGSVEARTDYIIRSIPKSVGLRSRPSKYRWPR
jgi:predicted ATPase